MNTEIKKKLAAACSGFTAAMEAFRREYIKELSSSDEKARMHMYRTEMYGNQMRDDMIRRQPKQTIKYGDNVISISKHQPVAADFWR